MASPDTIMQRLEALKLWQEAEQQKLIEQQIAQRNLLISEQQRMYEVLGLSFSTDNSSIQNSKIDSDSSESSKSLDESKCSTKNKDFVYNESMEGISVLDASDDSESSDTDTTGPLEMIKNSQTDISHNKESKINISNNPIQKSPNQVTENPEQTKPKKPFLKSGSGLVKYRMNLQDCKLKNIPKYKFGKTKINGPKNVKPKLPILLSAAPSLPAETNLKKPDIKLTCNRIPTIDADNLKLNSNINYKQLMQLKNRSNIIADNVEINCNLLPTIETTPLRYNMGQKSRTINATDNGYLHPEKDKSKSQQAWAKVLDNENSMEQNLNDTQQDMLELKVFELLEQKANNSSFCSTSSTITKFIDNTPLAELQNIETFKIRPHPSEIKLPEDLTDNESNDTKSTRASESDNERHKFRVRFADNVQMQSDSDTSETDLESCSDISSITSSCTSTPNIKATKFGESKSDEDATQENSTYQSTTEENTTYENSAYENTTYENTTYENTAEENTVEENTTIKSEVVAGKYDANVANTQISCTKALPCTISEQMNSLKADLEGKQQSVLLKQRLQELEKEIAVFRKENTALTQCKQEYELQKIAFQRQKRQIEVKLSNEKQEYDNYLAEEKKKLAEDRLTFEKYVNDLKKHPTRKEREEITILKEKVNDLQQEVRSKDAKYGASNARLRTQIKNLETELTKRQKTIDELKDKNKKLLLANNQYRKSANKKMLQEIQCDLAKVSNVERNKIPVKESRKENQSTYFNSTDDVLQNSGKKQNGYFSDDNSEEEISSKNIIVMVDKETMTEHIINPVENITLSAEKSDFANFKKNLMTKDKRIESVPKTIHHELNLRNFMTNNDQTTLQSSNAFFVDSISTRNHHNLQNDFSNTQFTNLEPMSTTGNSFQKEREEIIHPDGSKEIWYSNGNVKKISPDEQIVKMIYYNGDIKEIFKSTNAVKYFYAKNKMWHSTFSDGLEILEFPNGQTERRYKNGTAEIRFPDGSIRSTKSPDSSILDEWRYPDGSILINKKNGEKMLCMPNGQREIHTAEHRRREFPDGTVKLVYPDGSQETRYANGRIRTKDASGNLVKDTHAS